MALPLPLLMFMYDFVQVLADVVNKVGWSVDVAEVLDSSSSLGAQAKKQLEANTQEAADRGAFGVPS